MTDFCRTFELLIENTNHLLTHIRRANWSSRCGTLKRWKKWNKSRWKKASYMEILAIWKSESEKKAESWRRKGETSKTLKSERFVSSINVSPFTVGWMCRWMGEWIDTKIKQGQNCFTNYPLASGWKIFKKFRNIFCIPANHPFVQFCKTLCLSFWSRYFSTWWCDNDDRNSDLFIVSPRQNYKFLILSTGTKGFSWVEISGREEIRHF